MEQGETEGLAQAGQSDPFASSEFMLHRDKLPNALSFLRMIRPEGVLIT